MYYDGQCKTQTANAAEQRLTFKVRSPRQVGNQARRYVDQRVELLRLLLVDKSNKAFELGSAPIGILVGLDETAKEDEEGSQREEPAEAKGRKSWESHPI